MKKDKRMAFRIAPLFVSFLLVIAWWWWTNTWPVVAWVGNQPVLRQQIDKELFRQGGRDQIEGAIVQILVEKELDKRGITASDEEVNKKISELEENAGGKDKFEAFLKERNFEMSEVREQLELQLAIEKAVSSEATVSSEQVDGYIKENAEFFKGQKAEDVKKTVEEQLKAQNTQEAISAFIEKVKAEGRVWRLY